MQPNPDKQLTITVDGKTFYRFPIKTHLITKDDKIEDVLRRYIAPNLQLGDVAAISERIVAITQGRAFPISEIKPSWLAKLLVKFVYKPSYGIGIGSPWTMELAIREAGWLRLFLACLMSAITKPFGWRGWFYRIVGKTVAAIDGPTNYTISPYNQYAKLGPKDPEKVAAHLSAVIGAAVAIIDANDIGVAVLGASKGIDKKLIEKVFRDNPLGQTNEQTPICIVREAVQ